MALWGALACLVCGCTTVASGGYGVPVDVANRPQAKVPPPPLLVSASEAPSYSSPYLGLVEVTFENRTAVWKQVDSVSLDFGSPAKNQSVTIASADDMNAWERAITIRDAIRGTNSTTAIDALELRPVDKLADWVAQPDQQLLTTPFRIPPGLFAKRWILLSTPDNPPGGCVDSMILSYETSDHATGRVLLRFKSNWSDWQRQACTTPISRNEIQ
jgi:hypothetical protein